MDTPAADRVVDRLIDQGLIDPALRRRVHDVVTEALAGSDGAVSDGAAPATPSPDGAAGRRGVPQLVEVVAYLGGALVLAAGTLFLVQEWGSLGFWTQVALVAVVTVVLAVAGLATTRVPGGRHQLLEPRFDVRRRLAGTLLAGAALSAAFLVGLVMDHFVDAEYPQVYWPALVGSLAGVAVAAATYPMARTAVAVVGMMAGLVTAVVTVLDGVRLPGSDGDAVGVALFLLGVGWLAVTELGWFRESTVARSLGVTVALVGAQIPVMDGSHAWLGYLLTVTVAVAGILVYLLNQAWPYLAVAVIAVTLVVPEAVSDWTEGSLGAVGGVLVAGITLLAASFAGYRIRAGATD